MKTSVLVESYSSKNWLRKPTKVCEGEMFYSADCQINYQGGHSRGYVCIYFQYLKFDFQ